ncbi:MAG: hypothetical protein E7128_01095 [Rikenellaceae bacterium]|nr:hypothetical protein [Rikenellaceae bacterium]MBR2452129.1 hypothetical protein [Rikenellaceae bacterium]
MSMILRFRMLSDENDAFLREYEMPYDATLLDFNDYICRSLHYDSDMASFFLSDAEWNKGREFTLMDMGFDEDMPEEMADQMPQYMGNVTLGQIMHHNRDRLIYMFDMLAERAFYLELTGADVAQEGVRYPRTSASEAAAPDQYDASAESSDRGSIFDEVMSEFDDFSDYGSDDYADDEY